MASLKEELGRFGCDLDVAEFRDLLNELHGVMHPAWTDEELLFHPHDALRYCATVRCRTRCDGLPDSFILRTLVNNRKSRRRTGKE